MPPTPEEGIQWNKVTWYSKCLAAILFVVLVCGAFLFGIWYQQQVSGEITPIRATVVQTSTTSPFYKESFYGQIPSSWSTYYAPGIAADEHPAQTLQDLTSPSTLVYSFSPYGIVFGTSNKPITQFGTSTALERVDFYFIDPTVAQQLIEQANVDNAQIATETVGLYTSTVITYSNSNGQQDFLIGYPEGSFYSPDFLLMRRWSLGDQEFQGGFQYYLQTAQFQTEG